MSINLLSQRIAVVATRPAAGQWIRTEAGYQCVDCGLETALENFKTYPLEALHRADCVRLELLRRMRNREVDVL